MTAAKVIVGLGNPGHTYHQTRHNVGFMVIEQLANRHAISVTERVLHPDDGRPAAVVGRYQDGERAVQLLMPLTMMNESGEALRAAAVNPHELLVVCDDVNLPLGAIRLRPPLTLSFLTYASGTHVRVAVVGWAS